MDGDGRGRDDEEAGRRPSSTARAAGNATEVALGYGLAGVRAGLNAAIGIGRATTQVAGQVVERSPIGAVAGSVADALEPAAARARRQRAASAAEAQALIEAVVQQVAGEVVSHLDVDGIVREVDVEDIIRRVDVDEIVKRVDVDAVVRRVDVDEVVNRVDIDEIVSRTEVGSLIVQSTGGVATEALDVVRSQGVGLDGVVTTLADKVFRRRKPPRPDAPPRLVAPQSDEVPSVDSESPGADEDS